MYTEFGLVPFAGTSFFLLDLVIKSTLILVVALLMTRCLRRASASVRYAVWGTAVLAVLALPVINWCVPKWTIAAGSINQAAVSTTAETASAALPVFETQMRIRESTPQAESVSVSSSLTGSKINDSKHASSLLPHVMTLFNVFWLTGAVAMLIRLSVMHIRLRTVSRKCDVVTTGRLFDLLQACRDALGYSRPVRLLVTEQPVMPMTWGIVRPSILLPREAEHWPEQEVRCALLHELAHVSRLDCLSQLFVQLACVLYWFNPLIWIAARSIQIERELACDDLVLQNGIRASDYADQLLQVVSRFQSNRSLEYAAVSMAARNGFRQRLKAILHETQDRRPVHRRTTLTFVISFIGLTGLLGVFPIALTETVHAQQASREQTGERQSEQQKSKAEPLIRQSNAEPIPQQSLPQPPKKNELKSIPVVPNQQPFSLNGRRMAPDPGMIQPAVRSLNIVFAHDPGIGNYDGVVGRPNDVWNSVDIGTTAVDYTRYSDASPSTARLRISRHDGEWGIKGQSGIFQGYIYHNCRCVDLETKVLDLPAGNYKIYVFAHGDAPNQNAEIELKIGKRVIGKKATANDGTWNFRTQPYREGLQYVSFDFTIAAGQVLTLISHRAGSDYSMFNAIQIVPQTDPAQQKPINTTLNILR